MSIEIDLASERLSQATKDLVSITFLPFEIGARVAWTGTHVKWERKGDNEWVRVQRPGEYIPYVESSEYIVSQPWEVIQ